MDFYKIKSTNPADYMTIVREMEDGCIVKIVRNRDGYEEVITDFLSKTLFESCLRTGYIEKVTSVRKLAVNA